MDVLHLVTIEGGIGVGKSTVMDALRKARPSLLYIDEPVKQWEDSGLLEHLYRKTIPPGTFQIAAMTTRMAPLLKAVREGHRLIVSERCPYSDLEVFTKVNLEEDSADMTAYMMASNALMTAMPEKVYLYNIYLRADVDTLLKRMAWRGREAERVETPSEASARLAYLKKLQDRHEAFYNASNTDLGVDRYRTVLVDAEQSVHTVAQQVINDLNSMIPVKLEPIEGVGPVKRVRSEDREDKEVESPVY